MENARRLPDLPLGHQLIPPVQLPNEAEDDPQSRPINERSHTNIQKDGIKDVGIIGVDSGWEMYLAGNGSIKTEVAQFFAKLTSAAEVMEHTGAFMQLNREEGWYLERTVHCVARVGLDHVQKKILGDPAGRAALWARLQHTLAGEPDPWFAFDKAGVDERQFTPACVSP